MTDGKYFRAKWDGTIRHVTPGVHAYRTLKCRCPECAAAMEPHWAATRERDRSRRMLKAAQKAQVAAENGDPIEAVDWSEVAYLKPGALVRRRTSS